MLFGFLWFQHLVLGWVEGRSPERPGRQGGPLLSFSICRLLRWLYGGQTLGSVYPGPWVPTLMHCGEGFACLLCKVPGSV